MSIKFLFVGYPNETMGYSFYYPPENKVIVAQNAEFFENSLITQEVSGSLEDLEEEVYMVQHEGNGINEIDEEMKKFRFTQNCDESCVYVKSSGSNFTFLILYVDDILIIRNHIPLLQGVKSYLGKCFAMKDLGEAAYILRIKIYKDRSRRLIRLCQSAYIEKILKRLNMENSKRGNVPMQETLRLSKTQGASTPDEVKHMKRVPYASAIRCTRPNVTFALNITNQFQQNPENT
ncbi:retrotransposon protein, putative, ty1-copia subclass [Tanacetum coccineum]